MKLSIELEQELSEKIVTVAPATILEILTVGAKISFGDGVTIVNSGFRS
jgi:hypothetical protein